MHDFCWEGRLYRAYLDHSVKELQNRHLKDDLGRRLVRLLDAADACPPDQIRDLLSDFRQTSESLDAIASADEAADPYEEALAELESDELPQGLSRGADAAVQPSGVEELGLEADDIASRPVGGGEVLVPDLLDPLAVGQAEGTPALHEQGSGVHREGVAIGEGGAGIAQP